jgi:hypothetical protein
MRCDVRVLAINPGKRRTEVVYFAWFLATLPMQAFVTARLSYTEYNDAMLLAQATIMALGTLALPVLLRTKDDVGLPLRDLYAVRMGCYLTIWAIVGGFVGTDPWYEVLHGHFAFNTQYNPNGVPLFMLPMTIAVFGFYTVILGSLYRLAVQACQFVGGPMARDTWYRHLGLALCLAPLMPLMETLAYTSPNYCFDSGTGQWGLNVAIYGSWHFAALLFYPRFDDSEHERTRLSEVAVKGFATVGILVFAMAIIKTEVGPIFTDVRHGVRYLNDWDPGNCLGPKPSSHATLEGGTP